MRVLVTGASGFAGDWLARACRDAGEEVLGISRSGRVPDGVSGAALDLRDAPALERAIAGFAPDVVYHLAALASVGRSWTEPADTLSANVGGAVSLLAALRSGAAGARIVWVSSCEVYGSRARLPTGEDAVPEPESPYAVSKLAAEQLAGVWAAAHGLNVVIARPFSHTGPGQAPSFLMANLCRQAALATAGPSGAAGATRSASADADPVRIVTGRASTRRDVSDVRDVVSAYRRIAAAPLHGVVNVCSGASVSAAEQVAGLRELLAPRRVEHVVDPARVRASEIPELRGDATRLREATGWAPRIPFAQTLADTLRFWEQRVAEGTA